MPFGFSASQNATHSAIGTARIALDISSMSWLRCDSASQRAGVVRMSIVGGVVTMGKSVSSESSSSRKIWDAVTRRETADAILEADDPVSLFREIARKHKLQAYQLYAWVGQAAIARQRAAATGHAKRSTDSDGRLMDELMRRLPSDVLGQLVADALKNRKG